MLFRFSKNKTKLNRTFRCISCHICSICKKAKHPKAFDGANCFCAVCGKLQTSTKCAVCEYHTQLSTFSEKNQQQIRRGRPAVCQACETRGFSALDTKKYTCNRCQCVVGHLLCNQIQLKNRTYQKTPITCLNCRTREERIIRKLKARGAWKCTCKQLLGHSEKCNLYPTRLGERRWPGKNKGVDEDDWKFIETVWKKRKG